MAYLPPQDRVQEKTSTEDAADFDLTAVTGMRRFSAMTGAVTGDTTDYAAVKGPHAEVGIGTIYFSGGVFKLIRTEVKWSTNGNNKVSFGAGYTDVFNSVGAHIIAKMLRVDVAQAFSAAERARALASLGLTNRIYKPGTIVLVNESTPPDGTIAANGAEVLRADFPDLASYVLLSGRAPVVSEVTWAASAWGAYTLGTSATKIRVPDFRGENIRGLDAGRGIDSGRSIGVWQNHQVQVHGHVASSGDDAPDHSHLESLKYISVAAEAGSFSRQLLGPTVTQAVASSQPSTGGASTRHQHPIAVGGMNSGNQGSETRDRNLPLLVCVAV